MNLYTKQLDLAISRMVRGEVFRGGVLTFFFFLCFLFRAFCVFDDVGMNRGKRRTRNRTLKVVACGTILLYCIAFYHLSTSKLPSDTNFGPNPSSLHKNDISSLRLSHVLLSAKHTTSKPISHTGLHANSSTFDKNVTFVSPRKQADSSRVVTAKTSLVAKAAYQAHPISAGIHTRGSPRDRFSLSHIVTRDYHGKKTLNNRSVSPVKMLSFVRKPTEYIFAHRKDDAQSVVDEDSLNFFSPKNDLDNMVEQLRARQKIAGDSRYLVPKNGSGLRDEQLLRYGFVMKEFAQRVLSRQIAQSHVIVMAPLEGVSNSSVGVNLLRRAREENHTTHAIHVDGETGKQSLDTWWSTTSKQSRPNWILLAVLDLESGREDEAFSSQVAASKFLTSGPAITYMVMGVTASTGGAAFASPEFSYTFGGKETVKALLTHNYKVQLLSATDFWYATSPFSAGGPVFRPNDLIDESNVDAFFRWGATCAAFSEALVKDETEYKGSSRFKAYLFATQGLDLAIPSRRKFLTNGQFSSKPFHFVGDVDIARSEMIKSVPFKTCQGHNRVAVRFRSPKDSPAKALPPFDAVSIFCDGRDVSSDINRKEANITTWMNTDDSSKAESFCIKINCDGFSNKNATVSKRKIERDTLPEQVACATRILSSQTSPTAPEKTAPTAEKDKPNLLVVMIDPISRSQFDFMLPRTRALLDELGFTRFGNYTTVGDNSGPNQAALYAGKTLVNRDGIAAPNDGIPSHPWLWDELREAGYATFKAEDGCIANSNMVRSLQPNTTHGQALHELFCFHFSRPNCVGQTPAAEHLLTHARQFIEVYSEKKPWAAFLSLIDSHEDSMTLAGIIDSPIERFLEWVPKNMSRKWLSNALVVVLSDHGLHYGPYFQSSAGEKERSEPVLYMRLPEELNNKFGDNLRENKDKWVTPFDVHETFLEALGSTRKEASSGSSL
jgi:hypothetical protein